MSDRKERPILFSAPMVRALLDGSKTQTRRVMKPQPEATPDDYPGPAGHWWPSNVVQSMVHIENEMQKWTGLAGDCSPYGKPGDRLWVRETFLDTQGTGIEHRDSGGQRQRYAFAADSQPGSYGDEARKEYGLKWKPSIHMPRAASRILLEIVSVRVERLNAISEEDCWAEGIEACDGLLDDMTIFNLAKRMNRPFCDAAPSYAALWETINGAGSWAPNPWVWVIEFRRIDAAAVREAA